MSDHVKTHTIISSETIDSFDGLLACISDANKGLQEVTNLLTESPSIRLALAAQAIVRHQKSLIRSLEINVETLADAMRHNPASA